MSIKTKTLPLGLVIADPYFANFREALNAHNPKKSKWNIYDIIGIKIDDEHEVCAPKCYFTEKGLTHVLVDADMFNIEQSSPYFDDSLCIPAKFHYVYIPAKFQPSPFKTAYRDKEELINEFKTLLSEYLPSDFPWEAYIGQITCVYEF